MPERQELLKPPLHVLLTQDRDLPRGIQLFPQRGKILHNSNSLPSNSNSASSDSALVSLTPTTADYKAKPSPESNLSNVLTEFSAQGLSPKDELPRLDLNIWLSKTKPLTEFPTEAFGDWLRMMPILAQRVRIDPSTIDICTLLKFIQSTLVGYVMWISQLYIRQDSC
jgi:hypothetical protein